MSYGPANYRPTMYYAVFVFFVELTGLLVRNKETESFSKYTYIAKAYYFCRNACVNVYEY